MSTLTKEQFEQVPDFLKSQYEQDGDNYVSIESKKVASLKESMNGLDAKYKGVESKLSEFEKEQEAKIEAARKEAMEQARSKGDVEAIEKRYQEQMADLEKRVRQEERDSVLTEIKQERAQEKAQSIAAQIANQEARDPDSARALETLLGRFVQYDVDTGKEIYLDESGSATSLDRKGFIAEVLKNPMYKGLLKSGIVTNGGGNVNGSGSGSATSKANMGGSREERAAAIAKKFNL